jgi:hypothetical protein
VISNPGLNQGLNYILEPLEPRIELYIGTLEPRIELYIGTLEPRIE